MRALTLTQPWAGLVASGIKLVENRPRPIVKREDFGKSFAIHASREFSDAENERILRLAPYLYASARSNEEWWRLRVITSAVIGVATIADAFHIGGNSAEATRRSLGRVFGPEHQQECWTFGPTCYLLRDVLALERPVPCRGWQGFWTLPADVERQVVEQL